MQKMQKGWDPGAAAEWVNRAQVDYSALSQFERDKMRLFIPFYTFSRRSAQTIADELFHRPGGPMAQTIRAANTARDPHEPAPDYVLDTMAIPLGEKSDGSRSYMTGLGLMHEDALNLLNGVLRLDAEELSREVLGRSNPLFKAVVEIPTGESLFQRGPHGGRDLEDVDPPIGRTISNIKDAFTGERTQDADPFISQQFEYLVANSPASRFVNTVRTATDSRKWENPLHLMANLGTGVRVTDISPVAQDAIANERLGKLLEELGAREFSTTYVPDNKKARLTEEEKQLVELLEQQKKVLNERFRIRREAKEASLKEAVNQGG